MAAPTAIQPPGGGLPPQLTRSFADALTTTSQPRIVPSSQSHPSQSPTLNPSNQTHTLATHGTHRGFPSIAVSDSENADLSKPFTWALIGKFSQGYNKQDPKLGRPSVDELQKYFAALDFKGSFQLGLLDNRHLLIQFQCEEDYIRMFSRMVWYIRRVTMRILKWSPFFHVNKESSVVPIWISLPHLPVHLFQKAPLFSIASLFGHPLRLDDATTTLKRPSVARVQVEIDVLKELPGKIWIHLGTQEGFWQEIVFENVPSYCSHCWKIGHAQEFCHVQNPTLRPVPVRQPQAASKSTTQPRQQQVFIAKAPPQQPDTEDSSQHAVQENALDAKKSPQQQTASSDVVTVIGDGSIKPPPVEQIQHPILPAATLPSVNQPLSMVNLESLTEAPPIQPESTGACAPLVQTSNLSPRVAVTKSPVAISPGNNNGVQKVLLELPEKNATDSLVSDNGKACSPLPNEMGQNVAKMKATLDNLSGEGSSKNLAKFSDAELSLLDDVQYFDPRT